MAEKQQYERLRDVLLSDTSINKYNRNLFKKFFEWEETKLKRINDLKKLDDGCYKTLKDYPNRFRNVNNWFKNKPWNKLTKEEISQVYNDLEDGKIVNKKGVQFADRRSYYNKVFKSKPFKLAGLGDVVEEALEFFTDKKKKEVRFVNEETFKKMITVLSKSHHIALFWLEWDIGENITSLLKMQKKHCKRSINKDTNEVEYRIYLPQENLKRSRQVRSEITLFPETAQALDVLFERGREIEIRDELTGQFKRKYVPYEEEDLLFGFGYRQAVKLMDSVVKRVGAKCEPTAEKPTWKDLRSGMACNLLILGWHAEDINLRLGHSPLSRQLDVYINYLATNKKRAVKEHHNNSLGDVKRELKESKQIAKSMVQRVETQKKQIKELMENRADVEKVLAKLKELEQYQQKHIEQLKTKK